MVKQRPGHNLTPAPKVGFVTSREYLLHELPEGHPESPSRLQAVCEALKAWGLWDELAQLPPRRATEDELLLVHTKGYVDLARREILAGRPVLSTGDTEVCPRSYDVALLAVGGVLSAVDAVCADQVRSAFCAVRPPGHHATPSAGMGFCVFNNIAVAARYARKKYGLKRVLIVDWDLHHGNGTQDAFYDDPSVFYFSTHELDQYPMPLTGKGHRGETGVGAAAGTNLNCPLRIGSGDEEFIGAFERELAPAAKGFQPELVLVSAGFDCRIGDPLGHLAVTDDGLAAATRAVMKIAEASAGGRIVSVLEGGYSLSGLASGAATHVAALMGK